MLGSIDCMHWEWKNRPFGWQGQYKGHVKACTVILEAVALQDLWIWHSFFGMAGSHNDINVLQRSPVFARLAEGHSPPVNFEINGHQYNKGCYLADGIYPQWSTFVKTISKPQGEKRKRFAQMQESARKDVERAFGVLQSRWSIVRNPALSWDETKLWEVMTACVIMHNMIVEDERDESIFDQGFDYQGENIEPLHQDPTTFEQFVQFHRELRDWHTHLNLQNDLVEHVWDHIGNQ
nr:protein ALP1-like [Aegilops tauschii subsp. strangulata]